MRCLICGQDHASCKGTVPYGPVHFDLPERTYMAKGTWVSPERYYLTKDGRVVGNKDPEKLTLLVAKGGVLPLETAKQYGLTNTGTEAAETTPTSQVVSVDQSKKKQKK